MSKQSNCERNSPFIHSAVSSKSRYTRNARSVFSRCVNLCRIAPNPPFQSKSHAPVAPYFCHMFRHIFLLERDGCVQSGTPRAMPDQVTRRNAQTTQPMEYYILVIVGIGMIDMSKGEKRGDRDPSIHSCLL